MFQCFHCQKDLDLEKSQIGVSSTCEYCSSYLHCCKNCQYFSPGKHNDCHIPEAILVSDKENKNFCDYFEPGKKRSATKENHDKSNAFYELFGEAPPESDSLSPEEKFKKLFQDD